MSAYLLTWNPMKWNWTNIDECINELYESGKFVGRWSCGNTKRIQVGDRIFIIQLGRKARGIFASGKATSRSYYDVHWDRQRAKNGETALYIDVDFDNILNYSKELILSRTYLEESYFKKVNWSSMSSGISIPDEVLPHLEELWSSFLKKIISQSKLSIWTLLHLRKL
jgi:5-methylcytosine-specific restriction protein A